MLTRKEAAKKAAELDARWETISYADDKAYHELVCDELFAPPEVRCPIIAELMRRAGKDMYGRKLK